MELCETRLTYNNQRRCYIDGKPVSRSRFEEAKRTSRLDTFRTVTGQYRIRQLCSATPLTVLEEHSP